MGKSYGKELRELDSTYCWALSTKNEELMDFVGASSNLPLLSVGSGGSRTAAILASLLHQNTGMLSKYLTPVEMVFSTCNWRKTSMILLTAGGSNPDILTSIKTAIAREPRQLMILCATRKSQIGRIARGYNFIRLCELEPPLGKDGFLATNSLLTFAVLLTRAYVDCLSLPYKLPESLKSLIHADNSKEEFLLTLKRDLQPLLNRNTLVVLYAKWGKPPAFDLESRFTEAALCNVQLADYRNFAHGRHHWLAENRDSTGVIGLTTPQDEDLAERTLSMIPKDIPIAKLATSRLGPIATLSLIVQVMYVVDVFGNSRGVDPGRPHIPEFGRRIYRLRIPRKIVQKAANPFPISWSPFKVVAISRKAEKIAVDEKAITFWDNAYQTFVHNLVRARFDAIVFDYDGTLCDPAYRYVGASTDVGRELSKFLEYGIIIGIATGRGKSVRRDFQRIIPKAYWSRVLIGYYNGSDIGPLDDNTHPNKNLAMDHTLKSLLEILENHEYLNQIATYECRPKQITFSPNTRFSLNDVVSLLLSLIEKMAVSGIRVLKSTHTIDVLAPGVSKLELVEAVEMRDAKLDKPKVVLRIGDKGEWPGNDFSLLSDRYSLSVDTVSADPESCWNLAPHGYRGVQATLYYLGALEIEYGRIKFNPKKLRKGKN